MPMRSRLRTRAERWYWPVSWLFARKGVVETVTTTARIYAPPEQIWNRILFYEEVPKPPPLLLRIFLSHPLRTEGDKSRVGAFVRCVYTTGELVKRITAVKAPHFLQFEVMRQGLGIESCIVTLGGWYRIDPCGDVTQVGLATNYLAYLHPRSAWRPLEAHLVSQLHHHILCGIASNLRGNPAPLLSVVGAPVQQRDAPGAFACTASSSPSRR